ncbi:MAG: hypothetical protein QNL04_04990 [SAR324 cluster bacterium]|nr:hypothetical protein [SAR324 cluster bacterium]
MRLFLCLFICLPLLANAQEIATKKVAVQALHLSQEIRPVIQNHSYEPKRPERGVEPFSPKVKVKSFSLPKGMMVRDVPVHWLTEFSGGLAATFLGSKGQFQRGQLAYKEKRYEDAKKAFAVLFKRKGGDTWEQAGLWQAWTLFQLEEMSASFDVASELFEAKDLSVRSEAYYIAGLSYYLSSKNQELFQLLKDSERDIPKESRSIRLHLLKLSALARGEKWNEAHQALLAMDIKSFERDLNYKRLVELEAVIAYHESDFKNSLRAFITLEKLQNDLGERLSSLKNIAWMNYFNGDYEKAKKTAHFVLEKLDLASQAEMHYLWIAAQVRLQKSEGLFAELKELPQSSDFYSFASFYIRSFFKELKQYPDLKNQVQSSSFSFPELKFYTAILEGHRHFLAGDMDAAEAEFLQALAVDSKSGLYWVAQYNMALVHMKAGKLEKGLGLLGQLLANPEAPKHLIQYHQLFVLYSKKQDKEFLSLIAQVRLELLSDHAQWEVSLMHGALLYNDHKEKLALALFKKGWEKLKEPEALGYTAQVYYFRGKFNKVLSFASEHPKPKSTGLIHWQVKSLLALKKFERAKRVIEDAKFKGDTLVDLHVEVWLNTKDFKKIIAKVQPLIAGETSEAKKIELLGYLGDAWYNLKDYGRAGVSYNDALTLAKTKDQRSDFHYNKAMSLFLAEKFTEYEKAAETALNEPLKDDTRFQITENYANYLQKAGKGNKAQVILSDYGKKHSFKKAQSQLQQIRLLKDAGSLEECSIMAKSPVNEASKMERRDMAILGAKCSIERGASKEVLASLENELLTGAGNYRKPEVTILLAQARNQVGGYAASQEMIDQLGPNTPKAYKLQAKLIKAENLFQMGQVAQSDKILGDPSQYHEVGIYPRALELQTQIKSQRGDLKQAVKNILRLYYKKGQSQEKKQAHLLRLAKLYASKGKKVEAAETLTKLNLSLLSPDLKPEYDKLQSQLPQN